jgi:Kef-type K+ transport system membrane component KefB
MSVGAFLLSLIAIFAAAKLFGELAERLGQPAVLGELVGGIVVGVSGLHLVDSHSEVIHLLAELGVILLLFLIGLETDLGKLLSVGPAALAVASVGVALPFAGGYFVGMFLGLPTMVSVFLGAALTATSVGITARVLSDLGHLKDKSSQIILGAAVVDDIMGLIILTVVSSLAAGTELTVFSVSKTVVVAFGFVIVAVLVGSKLAPYLMATVARLRVARAIFFASVMFAFALAYLADLVGSALIIGAFAAGLVLARTDKGHQIEREVHDIAQFFVPIFFVSVGAAVDIKAFNPMNADTRQFLIIGLLLTLVGVVGKILAGAVAFGPGVKKMVVGVGMVPRGEVGLIFAQIGLSTGILASGLYSSVALMVMLTTFVTPPALRFLLAPQKPDHEAKEIGDYVMDTFEDRQESAEGTAAENAEAVERRTEQT